MTNGVGRVVSLQKEMTTDNSQRSMVNSQQSTDISHGTHGEHGILSPTDDTDLKDFLPSGFNDSSLRSANRSHSA